MMPWPFFWWPATTLSPSSGSPCGRGPAREHVELDARERAAFEELARELRRGRLLAWLTARWRL
jgi:hypothetical protein